MEDNPVMILSGKAIADIIQAEIAQVTATLPSAPGLAVVLIGDHPSSLSYISAKRKACSAVGIQSFLHHFPDTMSEQELLALISHLNLDPQVDGILVQLPLPAHLDSEKVISAIDPKKDVDGFHPVNAGKLLLGQGGGFVPCTPLGIQVLLERSKIEVAGRDVVIVGRSAIVGKPLAALLMQNTPNGNATVTVVHSRTRDLIAHTRRADILVAAIGSPRFIKEEMVKEGAVVVDVGINRVQDSSAASGYRIVGDVDFNQVEKKCLGITPVPKGVGPMTVAMLLHNTLLSYQRKSPS